MDSFCNTPSPEISKLLGNESLVCGAMNHQGSTLKVARALWAYLDAGMTAWDEPTGAICLQIGQRARWSLTPPLATRGCKADIKLRGTIHDVFSIKYLRDHK